MKLHIPNCPKCGEPARGTLELLIGRADLDPHADGGDAFEYSGWTEIFWNEQRTLHEKDHEPEGPDNRPLVCCVNEHTWATAIDW